MSTESLSRREVMAYEAENPFEILTAVLPSLMILVLVVLVLAPNQATTASAQEPGVTPSEAACPNCQSSRQGEDDSTRDPEDLPAALDTTGYDEVVLSGQDDGNQVRLAAGQLLVVSLPANYSTGYRWHVAEVDAAVLQQVGEEYIQDEAEPGMDGVPGQQICASAPCAPDRPPSGWPIAAPGKGAAHRNLFHPGGGRRPRPAPATGGAARHAHAATRRGQRPGGAQPTAQQLELVRLWGVHACQKPGRLWQLLGLCHRRPLRVRHLGPGWRDQGPLGAVPRFMQ